MEYSVCHYKEACKEEWDRFVQGSSVNGIFLHTRRFLGYHPADRFKDCSLMVYSGKGKLCAVIPACAEETERGMVFYSHKGSTYGGIILDRQEYKAEKVIRIVEAVEGFVRRKGFSEIIYKNTPSVYAREEQDLLEWALYYEGYEEEKELNLLIDFREYLEDIPSNFSNGKRGNLKHCMEAGLILKRLETEMEIEAFHEILTENLRKHGVTPVHTVPELLLLKDGILQEECGFWGVFLGEELIAGSMMFFFRNVFVAHTQYLCARAEYNHLSAQTFLYYSMIKLAKEMGFRKLTWGISTLHGGHEINLGLTQGKEFYGSRHAVNRVFRKSLR